MYEGTIECSHDFYLKVYHLSLLSGDITYDEQDFLLIDECGDLNPVTIEIFKLLPARIKIAVGDTCVSGNTRILTSKGWRRVTSVISSLEKNKQVLVKSYDKVLNKFVYLPASNPQRKGIKQTYKLKTSRSSLVATDDHKVLTVDGYKTLKDLKVDDLVLKYVNKGKNGYAHILSDDQYQVCLGSFFGDGCILKTSRNNIYRLGLGHTEKQLPYLLWKMNFFATTVQKDLNVVLPTTAEIKGSSFISSLSYSVHTKSFGLVKEFTVDDVYKMNALALAVWVMDDGSIKARSKSNKILGITISTNSFTYKENLMFVDMLKANFGLEAVVGKDREYFELNFRTKDSARLLQIIKPYVNDCFVGKFKEESSDVYAPVVPEFVYAVDPVLSITPEKLEEVFDITVEGTNNYVASNTAQKANHSGIVTHNCQNVYGFNHTVNAFDILKDSATLFNLTKSFRVADTIAVKLEKFCKNYIDDDMVFTGVKVTDPTVVTTAYISRTNAGMITTMIELVQQKRAFSTVRSVADIFKLPLSLAFAKYEGSISDPAYKYLQGDIDDWYESPELQVNYKSPLLYIASLYTLDVSLSAAVSLILRNGKQDIINAYNFVKANQGKDKTVWLGTAHSFKGLEYDKIIINDDLNKSTLKAIGLADSDMSDEDKLQERNLYYVACSRAKKELYNATILEM